MNGTVLAVLLFRHIPPASEAGATTTELASALGEPTRRVQRFLATLERAGLIRREPHTSPGIGQGMKPARWWRS